MTDKANIVIVGGGVAGMEIATQLGNRLGRSQKAIITLIDKDSSHIWKPILHKIAAGTNDLSQQQVSFVAHASQHYFTYSPGEMSGLDRKKKLIYLEPITMLDGSVAVEKRTVHYDILIMAVGSCANDFNIPGISQFCYFIDSRIQARMFNRLVRMHLFRCAMNDDPLTVSVVGGGATGVELVAELAQLVEIAESYRFDLNKKIHINLIENGPRLLAAFPEKISRAVEEQLKKLGINVLNNTQVTSAEKEGLHLSDGQFLKSSLMVWAAGVKGPDFLRHMDNLATAKNNMLCVKPTLQTTLDDSIFAIGDCASCMDASQNAPLPPTAQVAHQQASYLIKEIPRYLEGKPIPPFVYRHLGGIVSLGKYNAFGSLGKYGVFPGGFIQGKIAQYTYDFIYRSHQKRLHGILKGYLLWLAERINKIIRPQARLD